MKLTKKTINIELLIELELIAINRIQIYIYKQIIDKNACSMNYKLFI